MSKLEQVERFLQSLLESNPPQLTDGQKAHCEIALENVKDTRRIVKKTLKLLKEARDQM